MANGGKLEVQIGADITDFEKKIKEVEFDIKELSKVKLEQIKLGLDTREITAQIKDAKSSLNGLKTAVKDTGGQISGKFTKQVGNGSNTLMQFSRIAQDAPYGIIGIGNNITATAEAFGHLKNQTGSAGGALKAMASSLMGTGGILLGVSLLTTGFTLLSQSGLSLGDIIDKVTGKFDKYGDAIKKASEEGAKSASKEISTMNALILVAQNDNRTKKDRLDAVAELKAQHPAYFKQLSDEKIMYGDLAKETQSATKALLERAIGEKLASKGADIFEEKLKANARYNNAKKKLDAFDIYAEKQLLDSKTSSAETQMRIQNAISVNRNKILDTIEEERTSIGDLTKQYDELGKVISGVYQAPIQKEVKIKEPKKVKEPKKQKFDFKKGLEVPKEANTFTSELQFKYTSSLLQMNIVPDVVDENLQRSLEIMREFDKEVNDLVETSLSTAFMDLGSSIGEAIASGGNVLSNIGSSLLSSLGSFISELGKKMITYGLLLAGFGKAQKAFEKGDATVKIGAGIAMVALGVAAVAAGKAVSSLGAKGRSGGGGASTSTGSGANQSSTSYGGGGFNSGGGEGRVVFEIAGTSLIGVLNNTTERNLRIGGRN